MSGYRSSAHMQRGRTTPFASSADPPLNYADKTGAALTSIWGIRRASSTATHALRVRRSSDSAEMDIGFAGRYPNAPLDSTSLLNFVGAGDGLVVTIYDQLGAFDFTQATTTKQAKIVSSGVLLNMITPDGGDGYAATAVTMGTPYMHVYMKARLPTHSTTRVFLEQTTNYNNNAQSGVIFVDNNTNNFHVSMRDTTVATDIDNMRTAIPNTTPVQLTVFMDRSAGSINTGTSVWLEGVAQSMSNSGGTQSDASGNFSTYDLYLFGRGAASLFCDSAAGLDLLVLAAGDSSAYRTALQNIVK